MYIVKNAFKNITRNKGKSILVGIMITMIMLSSCIALSIHKSTDLLIDTYQSSEPIEVSLERSRENMERGTESSTTVTTMKKLTVDSITTYADSKLVTGYYYTLESSVSSEEITPVSDTKQDTNFKNDSGMGKMNVGDYRLTGYSDPSYIAELKAGTKKITSGELFDKDSKENVAVISESLARSNDLSVGDSFTVYTSDSKDTVNLKVVAIYKDISTTESDNFMNMNALNSENQIYTNMTTATKLTELTSDENAMSRGLSVTYYLENSNQVSKFETELKEKGLDRSYTLRTNEDEVQSTIQPIQNLNSFSYNFLIVILVVGGIVLVTVSVIQIRDRKYEIGVLRAIGMSKVRVTLLLTVESFMIAFIALFIGTTIGVIASQPTTNYMLKNEIDTLEKEATKMQENFGPGNFERPDRKDTKQLMNLQSMDFVSNLKVSINLPMILILIGCNFVFIGLTGVVTSFYINRYEPNKILRNRN